MDDTHIDQDDGEPIAEELDDEMAGAEIPEGDDFYENLAEHVSKEKLDRLANELIEGIEEDRQSRSGWEASCAIGMQYLGVKMEKASNAQYFEDACGAFDPTILTALLYYYSTAKAALFPASGPANCKTNGSPNPKTQDEAERVKLFINYFLTNLNPKYYPDSEKLLWYVGICGSGFRKVCMNKLTNMPDPYFIKPQDFIVNANTKSLLESPRLTETVYLTRKEVMLKQRSGEFIKFDLPDVAEKDDDIGTSSIEEKAKDLSGVNTDGQDNKFLFTFYETHVDLDSVQLKALGFQDGKNKDSDIPRPYVVIMFAQNRNICAIRRNWDEGDDNFTRLECFANYYYITGFGIYGMGLAHILESSASSLTRVLRDLVDKGTLTNYPGGLIDASIKLTKTTMTVGPTQFQPIETGGRPIGECITMMPYGEPSQVLAQLRQSLQDDANKISGVLALDIPESNEAPVGTTYVKLQVANILQSTVLKSLHNSQGYELKLLFDLFGKYLPDAPYPFSVPGQDTAVMRQDFNDRINVCPISDPNAITSTELLIRNQTILQTCMMFPQVHDVREACYKFYSSMNVEDIDKILPKPPEPMPLDALSENMKMMLGQPVVVELFQDHPSHKIIHDEFANNPMTQQNPQLYAMVMLHKQEHEAAEIYQEHQKMMQQHMMQQYGMMGQSQHQLKPQSITEIMLMPEVQNMISQRNAQESMQRQQAMAEQQAAAAENQVDPSHIALMDIEQHRESAQMKAQESQMKMEAEIYKANLQHETEELKSENQRQMSEEKNEVDIAIEISKQELEREKLYSDERRER